jgi:NTP pyrophosphatase (non-canonical NTP hydrolase)
MEEVGELAHEICRGNYNSDELKDAFGDIQVVLIILGDMLGIDIEKCKEDAYNVIKNRTGKTSDGCFIKENE